MGPGNAPMCLYRYIIVCLVPSTPVPESWPWCQAVPRHYGVPISLVRLMAGDRSSLDSEESLRAILKAGVTCIVPWHRLATKWVVMVTTGLLLRHGQRQSIFVWTFLVIRKLVSRSSRKVVLSSPVVLQLHFVASYIPVCFDAHGTK